MFVSTIEFTVDPAALLQFMDAILEQAEATLKEQAGCHQFEVSQCRQNPKLFFLYSRFDSEADFQCHLDSPHYLCFTKQTNQWVIRKQIRTWFVC
ncbi:putative quinol monooxygenase [Gayadomonas joobiniege]|uniref:putative quinol monooxygenase n=1 Tax=Gayadomonas joobiniege TaxID=1234606 RepID=UPI000362BB09|nr:putative quinol monooxygenase [Gayadomonas joobiniege]